MMEDLRFQRAIHRAIRTPQRPENNSPHLPSIHLSYFFSYACYKTHPRFPEWTTVHTRYLSLGDNVKISEARASFFQMEFRQASLIYEPTWTHQVTIKHSMSRLNSNGRDSTWQMTMIENINAFVLFDLYRKKINALCARKKEKLKDNLSYYLI